MNYMIRNALSNYQEAVDDYEETQVNLYGATADLERDQTRDLQDEFDKRTKLNIITSHDLMKVEKVLDVLVALDVAGKLE